MERIGTGAADDNIIAGEAQDRVIAAVAPNHVIAEGDTIERIDGFGVVRSFHVSHVSFPFLVRAKFHNRSIPAHRFVRWAARQWSLHLLAIDVGANVHVIWFTQLGVTRCDGDHEKTFSASGLPE